MSRLDVVNAAALLILLAVLLYGPWMLGALVWLRWGL